MITTIEATTRRVKNESAKGEVVWMRKRLARGPERDQGSASSGQDVSEPLGPDSSRRT